MTGNIVRLSEAKTLIINAYSNEIGCEMSREMKVDSLLVSSVKYGRITAKAAAIKMINGHQEMCTDREEVIRNSQITERCK